MERLEEVGGAVVVYFVGVESREAAAQLSGRDVYLEAEQLPEPEGGWYYFQLVGMPVWLEGEPWGEVAEVLDSGAQDVLVVKKGPRRFYVPLQAPYVSVENGEVHLSSPPAGLLE